MSALGPLFFWTLDLIIMALHAVVVLVCWAFSPLVWAYYKLRGEEP